MSRRNICMLLLFLSCVLKSTLVNSRELNLPDIPLIVDGNKTALLQLVMQRDTNLFFEAYPSYVDLNDDGVLDTTYKPEEIDYFGYFDSNLCYAPAADHLEPVSRTTDKKCGNSWSGDFLNYATMTRMDVLLTALYGGKRVIDTPTETRLRRVFVPLDNHTWGVEYTSEAVNGFRISDYTPLPEPNSGLRHLFATNNKDLTDVPFLRVRRNVDQRIWDWVDKESVQGDGLADIDLVIDVAVCKPGFLEDFCQLYPSGNYKPTGLLHEYGENNSMFFSLLTGSFNNNLQGGVLRQTVGSFGEKEVDPVNGVFTRADGIVTTLDSLQIPNRFFRNTRQPDCPGNRDRDFVNGECSSWGNPVAEMMFEGMRYYAGEEQPSPDFITADGVDATLGLTAADWDDPYSEDQSYGQCSGAYQLVISDPAPSYDGDQLPGSDFLDYSGSSLGDMHVGDIADFISNNEDQVPGLAFIGESGANSDNAPTAKLADSFRSIRGLAPDAPYAQGSYYASSVAYYGNTTDIRPDVEGEQTVGNYTLALGAQIPAIEVETTGGTINFVPFGRTVAICGDGQFNANNVITGVNIESLTDTTGSYRISFADNERGGDNDMDAIIRYSYEVNGNTVTMTTDSFQAIGSCVQHLGYTVSGTTQDGLYFVVRDFDTLPEQDIDYPLDVPPGQQPGGNWNDGQPLPLVSTITFTASDQPGAQVLESPLWYAAKWGGFNDENLDGIPQRSEWDADQDGTPDNYFAVTNPARMLTTLREVFQQISENSAAATSVVSSSGSLRTSDTIYRSEFLSGVWSGNVVAESIDANGNISPTPVWSAQEVLQQQATDGSREILTYNPEIESGVAFRWPANPASPSATEMSRTQIEALSVNPVNGRQDPLGEDRLEYVRGESKPGFRVRDYVLGDMVHSNPVLVGPPSNSYPDNWGEGAAENARSYTDFARRHRDRQRVVYVGANDGMLHAFDAGEWNGNEFTDGTGSELFAYVPSSVFPNLSELTSLSYTHEFFVDATPRAADVFINGDWRTVLIGGLRSGGQGIYALDITEPGAISERTADDYVLWEFTDNDDPELGFTYSSPVIARMSNGRWAAIMSGGYNSSAVRQGRARGQGLSTIFVLDIATGDVISKLQPANGRCRAPVAEALNGPTEPTAVDLDADNNIDRIYAGDLNGCVYAFDVSNPNPSRWGAGELKHEAMDDAGNRAPITAPIVVGSHPTGEGVMLYFGTGKYLEPSDQMPGRATRRFYALWDRGFNTNTAGRTNIAAGNMLQQRVTNEELREIDTDQDGTNDDIVAIRETSQESIDWNQHEGWYLNLEFRGFFGEQVIATPLLRDGKIFLNTHIPTGDECSPNQDGWFMVLDARSGAMLPDSQVDLDGNGEFDDGTFAGVSGLVNPHASPTIVAAGAADILISQTPNNPESTSQTIQSGFQDGRLTWRELEP